MKIFPAFCVCATISLLFSIRLGAQTLFIDDPMDAFHFEDMTLGGAPPGYPPGDLKGKLNVSIDSVFGNPGSSLLVELVHSNIAPAASTLSAFVMDTPFSWDPIANGAIKDVLFSMDVFTNDPGVKAGFAIGQGSGTSVIWPFPGVSTVPTGTWVHVSFDALPSTFASKNFTTGTPLTFGFSPFTFNSADPTITDYSVYFDNFKVQVDVIPEPASCALWLGTGAAALLLWRRKRRTHVVPAAAGR